MKPFHTQTPFFPVGPYRVQITFRHSKGPHWDGTPCPEAQANTFQWKPAFYRHEQEFCGFTTVTRGMTWGMLVVGIDICDIRH